MPAALLAALLSALPEALLQVLPQVLGLRPCLGHQPLPQGLSEALLEDLPAALLEGRGLIRSHIYYKITPRGEARLCHLWKKLLAQEAQV